MTTNVFILASGEQKRFGNYPVKQLLPVFGMPLIKHTIAQVKRCDNRAVVSVVTTHNAIIDVLPNINIIKPAKHSMLVETLLSVSLFWGRQTNIVLLGDVLYRSTAIETIYTMIDHFAGNSIELFACKWNGTACDRDRDIGNSHVAKLCQDVIILANHGIGRGKMWDMYYQWQGLDHDVHMIDGNFTNLADGYTRDFDTLDDYQRFLAECRSEE